MAKKTPQMSTSAPPPSPDPMRAEYRPEEAKTPQNPERGTEEREDHQYTVESRARWPDSNIADLNRESMEIDGSAAQDFRKEEEEGDEGSEIEPGKMKVAELKEALDEAGVDYDSGAKKEELVELYSDWLHANQ